MASITATICTSHQPAHKIGGKTQLLWKVHEQVASGLAVQVGFSDVNEADYQGLALSGSLGRELQSYNVLRL